MNKLLTILVMLLVPVVALSQTSTKKERNYIKEGNAMYNDKRYGDAEKLYKKALQENPASDVAKFNLATTYVRQSNPNDTTKNGILDQARKLYEEVGSSTNKQLAAKAWYDLGNISYNQKDFQKSIDCYKNSLRANPADDQARQNLRLAQKQLQNNQNNQNQNNQDKDNQDKSQDKQKDQKDKDQNKDQNQNQNQNNQNQNNQPNNGMSKDNADQILQTMQNEEKNTQDKVNKARMRQMKSGRRTGKQW
ncbi:MAG: tetratricopeptide repeat protein [Bacteroidales bacterium]|nr:tetratricopeptide repeat protein [Bacteroidales bacterium]MDD6141495.1 tetratricopeptide repeat protein [Bacteroidales bacterium]MDD6621762.1 tetratricopeptide repeat protein [Bacteroidales bacterium]MDD6668097.1 tetratricopeptide repeat protein [Bacteroidales bacterium]